MPDFLLELITYFADGGLKWLETGMILFMVVFLVWTVKLFLEPGDDTVPHDPED